MSRQYVVLVWWRRGEFEMLGPFDDGWIAQGVADALAVMDATEQAVSRAVAFNVRPVEGGRPGDGPKAA